MTSTPMPGHDRDPRRGERPAQRTERGADDEGRREHARHIDAHGRADLAVMDHGAAGACLACVRSSAHQATIPMTIASASRPKIVDGEPDAADRDAAEQRVGLVGEIRIDAPDQLDQILEHEKRRIGDEHQHDLVAPVHRPQQPALDQKADDRSDRDAGRDQQQEAAGGRIIAGEIGADRRRRGVGAERIEAAVRDVEDLHHAVDQGEPDRHDEQPGEVDRAVDEDREELLHGDVLAEAQTPMMIGRFASSCPGCGAARALAKRCTADPGPSRARCETVPGLQRTTSLRFVLRCARDTPIAPRDRVRGSRSTKPL